MLSSRAQRGTFDRRRERSLAELGMTPRMRLPSMRLQRRQLRRRRTVVALKVVARGDALLDGPFGEALVAHRKQRVSTHRRSVTPVRLRPGAARTAGRVPV